MMLGRAPAADADSGELSRLTTSNPLKMNIGLINTKRIGNFIVFQSSLEFNPQRVKRWNIQRNSLINNRHFLLCARGITDNREPTFPIWMVSHRRRL